MDFASTPGQLKQDQVEKCVANSSVVPQRLDRLAYSPSAGMNDPGDNSDCNFYL